MKTGLIKVEAKALIKSMNQTSGHKNGRGRQGIDGEWSRIPSILHGLCSIPKILDEKMLVLLHDSKELYHFNGIFISYGNGFLKHSQNFHQGADWLNETRQTDRSQEQRCTCTKTFWVIFSTLFWVCICTSWHLWASKQVPDCVCIRQELYVCISQTVCIKENISKSIWKTLKMSILKVLFICSLVLAI